MLHSIIVPPTHTEIFNIFVDETTMSSKYPNSLYYYFGIRVGMYKFPTLIQIIVIG